MEISPVRPSIKQAALLSLWVVFISAYAARWPLPGFFSHLYLIALAAVVTASVAGYGALLGSAIFREGMTTGERLAFSVATGWILVMLLMTFLGALGAWSRAAALGLVMGGLVAGWRFFHWPASWTWIGLRLSAPPPRIAATLAGVGMGLALLTAFAPITYYDSLVYHFALPQSYQQAGHWVAQPDLIYSAFPQNMEMIWLWGLLLMNDTLANLLGWGVAAALSGAVFCCALRYFDRLTAWWAMAFLWIMPSYVLLSTGGYVDVGLAFFAFMSFYAVLLWRDHPTRPLALLAGALAGAALGVKYTGGISVVIGALLILFSGERARWRDNIPYGFIYAGAAVLAFSPWLVKNILFVGNPVFPFFHEWSLKTLNPWVTEAASGYFRGLTEYEPRPVTEFIRLLWNIGVHGLDFGGGIDVLGDFGWALLFALLPSLWLVSQRPPAWRAFGLYALLFFIPWAMSRPVLRFLMPLAPILAVLAAHGFSAGCRNSGRAFYAISCGMAGALGVSGLIIFLQISSQIGLYDVPLGRQGRTAYLSKTVSYYRAAKFVNTLPEDVLVYVLGDQCGYYYRRPVIVTPVFNQNPLAEWANRAESPEALAETLRRHEVTHILINHHELQRNNAAYRIFPLTPEGHRRWDAFVQKTARRVYRDDQCEVLQL